MPLRNKAFHLLRQLFQQHTSRWQHELPELTKPQYAVMRAIAEHPGIEQVALTEAAVCTIVHILRKSKIPSTAPPRMAWQPTAAGAGVWVTGVLKTAGVAPRGPHLGQAPRPWVRSTFSATRPTTSSCT